MIYYSFLVTARIIDGTGDKWPSSHMVIIPVTIDKECPTTAIKKAAEVLVDYTCTGEYDVKFLTKGLKFKNQITSTDEVKGLLS